MSEPSGAKLSLTLAFAGLCSGLLLVGAYEVTLPIIKANDARALEAAVLRVVPGAKKMQKQVLVAEKLAAAASDDERPGVYAALDDKGALLGYAVAGEGPGFQDTIRLLYGYDPQRRVITGMEVLESRETPGLGDKIYKDKGFLAQFGALAVDPAVVAVKKGARTKPNELDAITGATISSKAVVKIINAANTKWLTSLPCPTPAGGGS